MVGMSYMSGSRNARNVDSITSRPNCGGSAKKAGTIQTGYWFVSNNPNLTRAPHATPTKCVVFRIVQVQQNRNGNSIIGNSGLG
jgi:hypothetical protein